MFAQLRHRALISLNLNAFECKDLYKQIIESLSCLGDVLVYIHLMPDVRKNGINRHWPQKYLLINNIIYIH